MIKIVVSGLISYNMLRLLFYIFKYSLHIMKNILKSCPVLKWSMPKAMWPKKVPFNFC